MEIGEFAFYERKIRDQDIKILGVSPIPRGNKSNTTNRLGIDYSW